MGVKIPAKTADGKPETEAADIAEKSAVKKPKYERIRKKQTRNEGGKPSRYFDNKD
jgi:hypothetical protein